MVWDAPVRHAATRLLECATQMAPADVRDWGRAMLAELHQVEGTWAAAVWALGGSSVLAKHALAAILIPGRRGRSLLPDGGLFARNVSLRQVAFAASAIYVVAALLFFAAPPFRQGLRVSLGGWNSLFHVVGASLQPRLRTLAKQAEARQDAEGMVFVATRVPDDAESGRLVDQAVQSDPNLVWAYAVVAVRHPDLPEITQWIRKLEQWDPHNALFPLITAESVDIQHIAHASGLPPKQAQDRLNADPAWQKAMAAAFASPKFDDYLGRLQELDRRVALHYHLNDPEVLLWGDQSGLPSYAFADARWFAKSLLDAGNSWEARGNRREAAEKYWAVARFGQVMDSETRAGYEPRLGIALQAMAYSRLQTLSESRGNPRQAALFAYLAKHFDSAGAGRWESAREWVFGQDIASRNAAVLQISSLMLLIFSILLIVAASFLIAGWRRRKQGGRPASGLTALVALTSAVGLLLSTATLYLTYRPYWYIFQSAILKGETSQTGDLTRFLAATRILPGARPESFYTMTRLPLYLWDGAILLAMAALILILLRQFRSRPDTSGLQQHPRVP